MFTLRPATCADAPALSAIYAHYVRTTAVSFEYEAPSSEEFGARMEQVRAHHLPFLVAQDQGQLLGYAYASPFSERKAYLPSVELTIYLAPSHKRQGLGRALYQALEQELKTQGFENLYACIATPKVTPIKDNVSLLHHALSDQQSYDYISWDSVRFHHQMGFRLVGVFSQCGFKFGQFFDMVFMEKLIGAHNATPSCYQAPLSYGQAAPRC